MKKDFAITLAGTLIFVLWLPQTAPVSNAVQGQFVITGQVVNQSGTPVAYASVYAIPDSLHGSLPATLTDANGKFAIAVGNPGRYRVSGQKYAEQYAGLGSTFHYPSPQTLPEVIVKADQPSPYLIVRLGPRAGILTGSIVDAMTHAYVTKFQIRACRVEAPRYCHEESFASNWGRFQMLVPATPILVEAFADGYRHWQLTDQSKQQPSPIHLESGETKELTVSLNRLGIPIEGLPKPLDAPQLVSPANGTEFDHYPRVTKLEWTPVPGAASYALEIEYCDGLVRKECKDPSPWYGSSVPPTSGIEGTSYQFSFVGAQPGRWRVWAHDAHGWAGKESEWFLFIYRR